MGFQGRVPSPPHALLIAGGRASTGLRSGWTNELVRLITLRLITGCHKERTRGQGLEALRARSKGSEVEEQPRSRALGLILRHKPPKVVNSLPSPTLLPFPGIVWALTNPPLLSPSPPLLQERRAAVPAGSARPRLPRATVSARA